MRPLSEKAGAPAAPRRQTRRRPARSRDRRLARPVPVSEAGPAFVLARVSADPRDAWLPVREQMCSAGRMACETAPTGGKGKPSIAEAERAGRSPKRPPSDRASAEIFGSRLARRRFSPYHPHMSRKIAAAATVACLAVPAVALAKTVYPGRLATLTASHLDKDAPVSITIQPYSCRQANNCGRAIKGTWYTNATGSVRIRFAFPRWYYQGCGGYPCSTHPGPHRPFKRGTTALVSICTINTTNYVPKCNTRKVRIT